MTDPNDLEAERQAQAERDFIAAREALAAQDQQQREAEQVQQSQWTSEEARRAALEASRAQQMPVGPEHEAEGEQRPHVDTVWMEPSDELTEADKRDMAEAFRPVPGPGNDNRDEPAAIVAEQAAAAPRYATEEEWAEATDEQWRATARAIYDQHDRHVLKEGPEYEQKPEALTREAIERDPMNAVNMPLPDNADCELLGVVADTAAQIAEDRREQAYTALYEGGAEAGKPFEAEAEKADRRFDEAAERFEAMACDGAAGDQPEQAAELLTPAEAFRSNAGTATMTDQQRKEADIGARIVALEGLLGAGDRDAAREYRAGQDSFAERIEDAPGPQLVAFLMAGKLAHAQDYAADLCEQAGAKLGLEDRFEEAGQYMSESRAHREIAGIERGAVAEPQQAEPEQIGQDMADAAKEALGGTPRPEFVIVGPSQEQQAGQQANPAEQIGQAHMPNYAELRAATEAAQEAPQPTAAAEATADAAKLAAAEILTPQAEAEQPAPDYDASADPAFNRPKRPDLTQNQGAFLELTTEGTVVSSRPANRYGSPEEAETIMTNGQAQTAAIMAGMVIVGATAGGEDTQGDSASAVMAENAAKAKREADASGGEGESASAAERGNADPLDILKSRAAEHRKNVEREEAAAQAMGLDHDRDGGAAMGGRGGMGM